MSVVEACVRRERRQERNKNRQPEDVEKDDRVDRDQRARHAAPRSASEAQWQRRIIEAWHTKLVLRRSGATLRPANPIEHLNREISRRTRAIETFHRLNPRSASQR